MKTKVLLVAMSFLFSSPVFAQAPVCLWANAFGSAQGYDRGNYLAFDASGNVYTTGSFSGTIDFDPGPATFFLSSSGITNDIFISKSDASGNFIWALAMGGASDDAGYGIAVDAWGNVYTTGQFLGTADFDPGAGTFNLISSGGGDIFISKLDSAGNFVWAKAMGAANDDVGRCVAADAYGNIYTTGNFYSTVDFDPGAGIFNLISAGFGDIFISKWDSSGNFLWAKRLGGTSNDEGMSVALDASGNVFTTGNFYGTADFNPDAGIFNLISSGFSDIFISKLDTAGNFVWAKRIGAATIDSGFSLASDALGNIYTTGKFSGTVDFDPGAGTFSMMSAGNYDIFISKLDSSGNFLWAKRMGAGSGGDDEGFSISIDAYANIYTTGQFAGTVDFDPGAGMFYLTSAGSSDIFISKLDSSGNFIWATGTGSVNADVGSAIAVSTLGNVSVTGLFYSPSISFNPFTLTNANNTGDENQ